MSRSRRIDRRSGAPRRTGSQVELARKALGISRAELGRRARVPVRWLRTLECSPSRLTDAMVRELTTIVGEVLGRLGEELLP